MAAFSGYVAIDELYDGPSCILSVVVDNRTYRRLAYRVLDHAPTTADVGRFLKAFTKRMDARSLAVAGITTDGSALYLAARRRCCSTACRTRSAPSTSSRN